MGLFQPRIRNGLKVVCILFAASRPKGMTLRRGGTVPNFFGRGHYARKKNGDSNRRATGNFHLLQVCVRAGYSPHFLLSQC